MQQSDQEFWHIVRAFLIRYNEYNREKGATPLALEEFDHTFAKTLAQHQLKQSTINKLTNYHNLILLAFLQDLAKWSSEYYLQLSYHPAPLEAILTQSIQVLNNQQQFHTIVAKQNQLICAILPLPYTFEHLDQFKILYRKLKDIKDYFPVAIREHQKKCFLQAVQELIEKACKMKNVKVIQFVFGNIFNQLEILEETHEFVSQRFRIVKKIAKNMWMFHEDIIFKMAYLVMKFSYHITSNPHLYAHLVPIYDAILDQLLQTPSITALLVFKHLILNNVQKILKTPSNSGNILLEGLLRQLSKIFTGKRLEYFMRNYDWNYLEVAICQQSLNIMYQYTENRAHQKLPTFELVKIYLNRIHSQIKHYLEEAKTIRKDDSKWKFYQLKRKEFIELQGEMNQTPKKIFKKIQAINNPDLRQNFITKCVKLIKKTSQLQNKAMINLMGTEHPISGQLFSAYAELMLKQCKEHNLEEFIRMFTSNFFLTGQSQQIARVLDTITKFFFSHQEPSHKVLKSSDATYTFANAILILNTDLHNQKVEEKISEENFLKMCKKINEGEDIEKEILRKTYHNIKKNKINTFRDRGDMLGISVSNWLALCTDYQSLPPTYYDPQLEALDEPCLQYFIHDVLSTIIDEKQTAKLQLLVERFMYDDKIFECEIIEVIRKVVDKKPHLPLHILQKIFELANFKNNKPSDKTLSYYWLAANLITSFPTLIPTNLVCQFLVLTWAFRLELQDNMHLRQSAQIKRIKQCIKNVNKRQSKKSIMDMFSNFLSFKESDDEVEPQPNQFNKRTNFKSISNNVLDMLKYKENHRKVSVQFFINYIHQEESKIYEEFLSCLFLTFNLLYMIQNCEEYGEDLFYELLGVKQSSITKRLANLGKKDPKLFNILSSYCRFWILKILLKEYHSSKLEVKENNTYEYMLNKSLEYLQKVDKQVLNDLIKEVQNKVSISDNLYKHFQQAIKKVYGNEKVSTEVQHFVDKFKPDQKENEKSKEKLKGNDEESNKQNQLVKNNKNEENCSEKKSEVEKQLIKKQDQGVQPEQELQKNKSSEKKPDEQNSKEEQKQRIEPQPIQEERRKKQSITNEEPVNADAMMQQIDRQIQAHHLSMKQDPYQQDSSERKPEAKGEPQKEEPANQEEEKGSIDEEQGEGQSASALPMILF